LLCALALVAGCATQAPGTGTTPGGVPVVTTHRAQGQDGRVLFLILHYTVADLETSLRVLTLGDVSAHYLISDEDPPRIFRLVDEDRRAWHSGASAWRGHALLNASSIGIEIVHPGVVERPDGSREYPPLPEAQLQALIALARDIVARHGIRPERILGHGEVAPSYKEDPGPAFPWRRLADAGLTPPWPDASRVAARQAIYEQTLPDVGWFQQALARHGYPTPQTGVLDEATRRVLMNFQMRYRPALHDGMPDAETAALLHVLNAPLP
jgi:N-acetylmuramoyl-L-alanine amidase